MQIDAHKRPLEEVLKTGQHIIPRYQRRYAWEEQNIRDFWTDITEAPEQHFLGSMVVSGKGSDPREVIDGQQRLTTTIISLAALRDLYIELGATQKIVGIETFIEFDDKNGERKYRLLNKDTHAANRLNDSVLLPASRRLSDIGNLGESREASAYRLFVDLIREKMSKEPSPEACLDQIRDAVLEAEVVYINVEDRKSAFTIFETLNDRGQSLTVMDLVKNLLLSNIPQSAAEHEDRKWSEMLELITDSSFEGMSPDQFLYYYWNSRAVKSIPSSEIVENARIRRSISEHLESAKDGEQASRALIGHMYDAAHIMKALNATLVTGGRPDDWRPLAVTWRRDKYEQICSHLYGILVTGSNQPFPLIISAMRAYHRVSGGMTKKQLTALLETVEVFQFRWTIAQKPSTSTIRRMYRRAASAVDGANAKSDYDAAISEFAKQSMNLMPTDGQFKDGLTKLAYSSTRAKDVHKVRHILAKIEISEGKSRMQLSQQMSVEHLQGQAGRSESTPRNFWIYKLGNLTLLPPGINSTLPDAFAEKAAILEKWVNPHDVILLEAIKDKNWNNSTYARRLEWILDRALTIWPASVPTSSVPLPAVGRG